MAEYYPLLARAVSAQPNATPETRNGIYERARKALLGQLTSHDPPVAENDIERERRALEEAITRVESEQSASHAQTPTASAERPADSARLPPKPPGAGANDSLRKPLAIPPPPRRTPQRPVMAPGSSRIGATAPPEIRVDKPVEHGAGAPALERDPPSTPEARPAPAVAAYKLGSADAEPMIPRSGMLRKFARPRAGIPDTGPLVVPVPAEDAPPSPAESDAVALAPEADEPDFERPPTRSEGVRPIAPLALPERRRPPILAWIVGALAAVLVIGVALLAFALRDTQQTLAAKKSAPIADMGKASGKIVDRIGGASTSVAGASRTAPPSTPSATQAPSPAPAPAAPAAQSPAAGEALPVAQRAALLIQAPTPDDPKAIATYVGTVVWRLDTVSPGPGQPVALAVRAEIDVPDAKFKGSMLFQKNADATLPASHTIELRFSPGPGSPIGDVRQIDTPQLREEDSPSGESLSGIPAPITANYFLVGLTKGDPAEARNIDLIRTRAWFDVPMLLANGKIAKITFEKGVSGAKALNDALASWTK